VGGWETSLSAAYSRAWSNSLLERGVDVTRLQALVDSGDPAFNPYGPLNDDLLLVSRNRTRAENLDARATAGKSILNLPAGPLSVNVAVAASRSVPTSAGSEELAQSSATRELASGAIGIGVPLSRRGGGPLGDLSIDLSAGGQVQSGSG
ncbi:hypothetical protein INQ23_24125, partial [Escherichia coli]|nr:hypothetical protein [Escherichia coli]